MAARMTWRAQEEHRPQQAPTPSRSRNSRMERQPSATALPMWLSVTALQTQTYMTGLRGANYLNANDSQ
ncbi:MAG: hypothetical protein A2045_16260 [Rhodocyclales bacterium GWA2_65_20]|nr:MAG: hypothetical protein A2045_16260 [Rhodocyclales bacterium GWA2_65_20]